MDEHTRQFLCSFCGRATDDDPRRVQMSLSFPRSTSAQEIGAHWSCLRAALHPLAAENLHDPAA